MFEVGNLLLFKPFIFKNGAKPKDKFMIVLGKDGDGNAILASLPTSKDHVPSDVKIANGCVELPDRMVNVFVFSANENIMVSSEVASSFSFAVNTFVYGMDLDTYPIGTFHRQMADEITEVKVIGRISDEYFNPLKECLKNSKMVKNKHKRIL